MPSTLVLAGLVALAPQVQPRSYSSPAGGWSLYVDPGDREGAGAAEYVLREGSREAWRQRLPFTLLDAVVADDGFVGGYSYGHGWFHGKLRMVILSSRGEVLLDEVHTREPTINHEELPEAEGLVLLPERFVLRVKVKAEMRSWAEDWWGYDLHSGESLYRVYPQEKLGLPERAFRVYGTEVVPGTPLWLVHWWSSDRGGAKWKDGSVFTLLDGDLGLVWKLDLPEDYMLPGDPQAEGRLQDEIREQGAILRTFEHGFGLRLKGGRECVTFAVEGSSSTARGWNVREVGREPYEVPRSEHTEIAVVSPRWIATVELEVPPGAAGGRDRSEESDRFLRFERPN